MSAPGVLRTLWHGAAMDLLRGLAVPAPQQVRLHLGLHKTATTHIQDTLAAMQGRLRKAGIDAPPTPLLRAAGFPRAVPEGAARLRGRLARLRDRAPVLVLSDERWLAGIPGALTPDPYADPEVQLAPVLPLLRAVPRLRVLVGLRDMGTHLPSAYAEALRFFPDTPPFEQIVAARLAAGASWLPALARLRALLPGATLTVWPYEGYRDNAHAVLCAICGTDPGPLPEVEVPRATRSPRAEDVGTARALAAGGLPLKTYRQRMAEVLDGGREGPPFALRDAAARTRFSEVYAADLEALARMEGVTLLRLGEGAP